MFNVCALNLVSEEAKDLMLFIIGQSEVRAMESFHVQLSSLLAFLAAEFKTNQVSSRS